MTTANTVDGFTQIREQYAAQIIILKKALLDGLRRQSQYVSDDVWEGGRRRDDPRDRRAAITLRDIFDDCYLRLFRLAADGADPILAFQAFEQYVTEQLYARAISAESNQNLDGEDRCQLGSYGRVVKLIRDTYKS